MLFFFAKLRSAESCTVLCFLFLYHCFLTTLTIRNGLVKWVNSFFWVGCSFSIQLLIAPEFCKAIGPNISQLCFIYELLVINALLSNFNGKVFLDCFGSCEYIFRSLVFINHCPSMRTKFKENTWCVIWDKPVLSLSLKVLVPLEIFLWILTCACRIWFTKWLSL